MATKTACPLVRRKVSPIIFPQDGIWFELRHTLSPPKTGVSQLVVTHEEVIMRSWDTEEIKNFTTPSVIKPKEVTIVSHSEFRKNEKLQKEMEVVFGREVVEYLLRLVGGHVDYLTRLPERVLHVVLSTLSTGDVVAVSRVNKYLNKVCHMDEVWEKRFRSQFSHICSKPELSSLVNLTGWYRLYIKVSQYPKGPEFPLKKLQEEIKQDVLNEEEETSSDSSLTDSDSVKTCRLLELAKKPFT